MHMTERENGAGQPFPFPAWSIPTSCDDLSGVCPEVVRRAEIFLRTWHTRARCSWRLENTYGEQFKPPFSMP